MSNPQGPLWQRKMCPELTKALLSQPKPASALVGSALPATTEVEVRLCLGPACMWFLATANEKGQLTGQGDCAVTCGPIAANQAAMASTATAAALTQVSNQVAELIKLMAKPVEH